MLNILFSASAAGTLHQMLDARGIDQSTVALTDTLDWGPIGSGGFRERENWMNRHAPLDFGPCDWLEDSAARFRDAVLSYDERLIWIAPRSAEEQSGLYWYLQQFGGHETRMVVADYALNDSWGGKPPLSLGELSQDLMGRLFDESSRVDWDSNRFPDSRWDTLTKENALLRIVDDGQLRSAKEDFFDSILLECCPMEWTKSYRVVGEAMARAWDRDHRPDSNLLFWRLRELISNGAIDCEGDLPRFGRMSSQEVRIRVSQP